MTSLSHVVKAYRYKMADDMHRVGVVRFYYRSGKDPRSNPNPNSYIPHSSTYMGEENETVHDE